MTACHNKQAEEAPQSKMLVLYYSQTGATEQLAKELMAQLPQADMEQIVCAEPYEGDFEATIARCKQERDSGMTPALNPLKHNVDEYDVIFVCYPVWFGTYALPIARLVEEQTFAGKRVVTMCTFGSGGLQSSTADLAKALPQAKVEEGFGIRGARMDVVKDELHRYLVEHGFVAGEVEALPAFMEHLPVTEAEKAIFDEACGDYQFPLGTPTDVAGRETNSGTDYEFGVESTDAEGNVVKSTVYVTKPKGEGAKAEFTMVVR